MIVGSPDFNYSVFWAVPAELPPERVPGHFIRHRDLDVTLFILGGFPSRPKKLEVIL
jgi:hypothetical protein